MHENSYKVRTFSIMSQSAVFHFFLSVESDSDPDTGTRDLEDGRQVGPDTTLHVGIHFVKISCSHIMKIIVILSVDTVIE